MGLATVDTTSKAFGARLAAILRAARSDQERSLRVMAWKSRGSFSAETLKGLETAQADLRGLDLAALASLYRIDLDALLQERVPLVIDPAAGTISTAGVLRRFDPGYQDGLLLAYLYLVRDLRDLQEARSITLRREDVEALASGLRADAAVVLNRLGELMGSTVTQRRSAVAMFAAGAVLIVLSTGAVALESGIYQPPEDGDSAPEAAIVTLAAADDLDEGRAGGSDLSGGSQWDLLPMVSSTGVAATASDLAGSAPDSAPNSSVAPGVVDAPSPEASGVSPVTPGAPVGTGGEVPAVGAPIDGAPVDVDVPVVDVPPSGPSIPDVPEARDAEPGRPAPGASAPDVPAVGQQPGDRPPGLELPVEVPSLVDGPPADESSTEAPPTDPLPGDGEPGDEEPGTDAPGSDGSLNGPDPESPELVDPDPETPEFVDPETVDPGPDGAVPGNPNPGDPEPDDADRDDAEPDGGTPGSSDPGASEPTPPADQGGTPGNSPAVGNTPNVGQPGNSGNPNAGGRSARP